VPGCSFPFPKEFLFSFRGPTFDKIPSPLRSSSIRPPEQFHPSSGAVPPSSGGVVAHWLSAPDCCSKVPGSNPASLQPSVDCHLQMGCYPRWNLVRGKKITKKDLRFTKTNTVLWNSSILPQEKYHPLSKAVPFLFRSSAILSSHGSLSASWPVLSIL
jgi:hypothetical protein